MYRSTKPGSASISNHIFIDPFTVNRIKELHKVTVRIPPDNEKSNLIRIEGDPQGVQEAKKELLELASRMVSRDFSSQARSCKLDPVVPLLNILVLVLFLSQENERTKDLIIEQRFHRAIIGQKGEKIKEVRDKFPEVSWRLFILAGVSCLY